jgi:hypothetical protein
VGNNLFGYGAPQQQQQPYTQPAIGTTHQWAPPEQDWAKMLPTWTTDGQPQMGSSGGSSSGGNFHGTIEGSIDMSGMNNMGGSGVQNGGFMPPPTGLFPPTQPQQPQYTEPAIGVTQPPLTGNFGGGGLFGGILHGFNPVLQTIADAMRVAPDIARKWPAGVPIPEPVVRQETPEELLAAQEQWERKQLGLMPGEEIDPYDPFNSKRWLF